MTKAKRVRSIVFTSLMAMLVLLWFVTVVFGIDKAQSELKIARLEETVRKCAVACYAEEGRYPEDIEYICEKYGLVISDTLRVEYEIFADNIMPVIRVVER